MKKWIYLVKDNNGSDDIKAAALAAVLSKSSEQYNVVHTSIVSIYLNRLENVYLGYPNKSEGDVIISLKLPNFTPFQYLCRKISQILEVNISEDIEPYLGFVRNENEIDRQLSKLGEIVAFCYYINDLAASFALQLDKTVELLDSYELKTICCGSRNERLLKGSYDYRELLQVDEIIKNRERIKAIVTSLPMVKEIGHLLHIPVVYLYTNAIIVYYEDKEIVESNIKESPELIALIIKDIYNKTICNKSYLKDTSVKKKFEVPYSFDEGILPFYKHFSSFISFLFLPPYSEDLINTRTALQSNRKGNSYMPSTREEYEYHLKLINDSKLSFVVLWQDRTSIITKRMLDYYTRLGAKGFIIANDKNAKIIKEYNPNLIVISSIVQRLCNDITKKDFTYYDYVVMFYPFNRSLNALKRLSKIKDKIVIMPNSICHTDCQGIHHWFIKDVNAFDREKSCPAFNDVKKSTFIRPDHLYLFDDFVGGYKLQGREWTTDYVVTICEAYFNRDMIKSLIPLGMVKDLQMLMQEKGLDDYYNIKTMEIEEII